MMIVVSEVVLREEKAVRLRGKLTDGVLRLPKKKVEVNQAFRLLSWSSLPCAASFATTRSTSKKIVLGEQHRKRLSLH